MPAVADEEKTILDFLPELQEALEYAGNTHGVSDVARRIWQGKAQLWLSGDGMVVTEIQNYPAGPVLNFWLAAGEMEDVLDAVEDAYEWGREVGCERATFLGRKGWARVLKDQGWEPSSLVFMEKEL